MPEDLVAQLIRWLPDQRLWQTSPVPWVLGAWVAGVGTRVVLWAAWSRSPRLQVWCGGTTGRALAWLGWMAWLVVPGYAALLLGVLSPGLMGLTQVDWGAPFGYGMAFATLAVVILVAAGVMVRQTGDAPPSWTTLSGALAGSLLLLAEAGALQWHWAFYRTAAIQAGQALGISLPLVWGTWAGLGIIVLEGALNPWLWRDLRAAGQAECRILRAVLSVATSVLFLLSRNFWLLWATHAVAAILVQPRLVLPRSWQEPTKKGRRQIG